MLEQSRVGDIDSRVTISEKRKGYGVMSASLVIKESCGNEDDQWFALSNVLSTPDQMSKIWQTAEDEAYCSLFCCGQ